MRIAMLSEHASPLAALGGADAGGQNVHVADLAGALADRGHDVVVYTRRDSAQLADRVQMRPGVTVEHLTAGPATPLAKDVLLPYVPELADELAARLADDPPDVVHAHFWMSGLAAVTAAPAGTPVVQTFHALGCVKRRHQGSADTSPPTRLEDERTITGAATRIIASCADEAAELVAMGARRDHIDIVPSGVDLTRFTPDGPAAPRTRRRRLLTLGRLVPRKGVDDAIHALRDLPDTELVVAGGPARDHLRDDAEGRRLLDLAAHASVDDRVHFIGGVTRDEVPALMRSADAVVCLPWYEPFGIVPVEAMACGVPVIGTAVGGLLDTVVDGGTGFLVPPREPAAAAAAIGRVLADPALHRRLSERCVTRARRYGWAQIARRTERTYERAAFAARAGSVPGGLVEVAG
jgi:glycosyltransferase involved in cell wall biosynthesis